MAAPVSEKSPAELFDELHQDLYNLARWFMEGEREGHTLQPTALLSEVWVAIFGGKESLDGSDRNQIIATAATAMRHILIDYKRSRRAIKRGRNYRRVSLDDVLDRCAAKHLDTSDLKEALDDLATVHGRAASAMTLRFIGGFKVAEIADQSGVSEATVRNDLKLARAWLRRRLGGTID